VVGKNESGKTAFLEAIARVNYFEKDENFTLNPIGDFPRNELSRFKVNHEDVEAVNGTFLIDRKLLNIITEDIGEGVLQSDSFSYGVTYYGKSVWYGLEVDEKRFISNLLKRYTLSGEMRNYLAGARSIDELLDACQRMRDEKALQILTDDLRQRFLLKGYPWKNRVKGYVAKQYLKPNLPKFWYFDEYYILPSRISLRSLKNPQPEDESVKISKAFFELAKINIDEVLATDNFEAYLADLEATANEVTAYILKYWSTDRNLEIKFEIENRPEENDKILDIRIRNTRRKVTLPLRNRSKGLNMFFSFIVWFSKIQNENSDQPFVLLLDEPGLSLHSTAQTDLMHFIDDLSVNYQIIYTTHSPFMVNPRRLDRIRTVTDTPDGSIVSNLIAEIEPETLFPLQSAIGFDITSRLFHNKKNLIVESPIEMLYIDIMSRKLKMANRTGLHNDIVVIPCGGLNRLTAFISLLKNEKLDFTGLFTTTALHDNAETVDHLLRKRLIVNSNLLTFDEYTLSPLPQASVEDMFEKEELVGLLSKIDISLNLPADEGKKKPFIFRDHIRNLPGNNTIDLYAVASTFALDFSLHNQLSENTLNRFETLFTAINQSLHTTTTN
ncbi:MAG TPA: AAA family ATPase, partial [Bacteroidales bacterium]|nr:AAA family ATPase [Bacteroidales bacterium]